MNERVDPLEVAVPPARPPLDGGDLAGWETLLAETVEKGFMAGTYRTRSPQSTLARIRPHLPAMGITRIANITGLDRLGIPVILVCRPNSRSLSTSVGKGIDLDNATVSGVMECIELHHAEHIMQPLMLASKTTMDASGRATIDLDRLPRIRNSRYHRDLPLLWIEGFDILARRSVWLPFETVHASALSEAPTGSGCFASTSNGLASGNHRLEAIVHAILEVIERDSVSVWGARGWAHRDDTAIDLATVTDPGCRSVIDRCLERDIAVSVFEVTTEIGVPAFLCEIREANEDWERSAVFSGLGCHFDPALAMLRALTEAVQSRLVLIAGSRDDLNRRDYIPSGHAPPRHTPRRFTPAAGMDHGRSFNADIEALCACLAAVGIEELVAVDLTSPRYDIPVVRVVIPGLEGPDDDPDYVPGARALSVQGAVP